MGCIARLSELDEVVDLILGGTPEHDADRDASGLDCVRDLSSPKMEHLDTLGGGDERNTLVVAHSPSNREFPGTGGGVGRGLGLDAVGRGGGGGGGARRLGGVVALDRSAGRLRARRAGRPRPASLGTTLLLGEAVVVGDVPSQVVGLDGESEGVGGSERA